MNDDNSRGKHMVTNDSHGPEPEDFPEVDRVAENPEKDAPPTRPATWADVLKCGNTAFLFGGAPHNVAERLAGALRAEDISVNDDLVIPLRRGLNFFLQAQNGEQAHVGLKPFSITAGPHSSIKSVPTEEVDAWRRLADELAHPAAKAHFHDLLFSRGGPRAAEHARSAAGAYLNVARVDSYTVEAANGEEDHFDWAPHSRNLALARALSLRHVIADLPGQAGVAEEVQTFAVEHLTRLVGSEKPQVGDMMLIFQLLVRGRRSLPPTQIAALNALLVKAGRHYASLDHVVDSVAALLLVIDPDHPQQHQSMRVRARLDTAMADPRGLSRLLRLEEAASIAHDFQLRELHDEAIRELQRIQPSELGLQTFTSESALPVEIVAAEIARNTAGATWREALTSWLHSGSPAGRADRNRESSEEIARSFVLGQLLPPTVIGRDGLPRWKASTKEDRRDFDLARFEMYSIEYNGKILAESLDVIAAQHGVPNIEELTGHLSHEGSSDPALARAFARALHRYWAKDFEGSLLSSALRIEAGARNLVLSLDEPAYRTSRQNKPGVYVGIPSLA